MLTRYAVETQDWDAAANIPLLVPSRDFVAVKLQLEAMAAAARKDVEGAEVAANKLALLAQEPGQHPFAQQIITMEAKEAEAFAAKSSGNADGAVAKMWEAVAIEDSIDTISQPPYPIIPANELLGTLLMELNRPTDAKEQFLQALKRTPGHPKAIYGIARAAQASGDKATAQQRYQECRPIRRGQARPSLSVSRISIPIARSCSLGRDGAKMAQRLGHWFRNSAKFWLNLQTAYDLRMAKTEVGREIDALLVMPKSRNKPKQPSLF